MRITHTTRDVDADTLREIAKRLTKRDVESSFLEVRLAYKEVSQVLNQYLPHFVSCSKCPPEKTGYKPKGRGLFSEEHEVAKGVRHKYTQPKRVYPEMLPTQASGRWSIKRPPMVTIPHPIQEDVILPDPGYAWVGWDLDAIEAKIVAAYSDDEEDLDAFAKGYDIHTITSCKMLGDPLPQDLCNPHTSEIDAAWRAARNWQGKDDKRRGLAKCRYCVLYGKDHTAVEDSAYAKEYVKKGGDRKDLVEAARIFLLSKPNLVATKKYWWEECSRKGEARTFLGRRRRLFGDKWTKSKEGWNHMVQGAVTDMVNLSIISITTEKPHYYLIYPSHDAAKINVPLVDVTGDNRAVTIAMFKRHVEKDWEINHHTIRSTAGWYVRFSDGHKEDL